MHFVSLINSTLLNYRKSIIVILNLVFGPLFEITKSVFLTFTKIAYQTHSDNNLRILSPWSIMDTRNKGSMNTVGHKYIDFIEIKSASLGWYAYKWQSRQCI